jgi:hypothetical protein
MLSSDRESYDRWKLIPRYGDYTDKWIPEDWRVYHY